MDGDEKFANMMGINGEINKSDGLLLGLVNLLLQWQMKSGKTNSNDDYNIQIWSKLVTIIHKLDWHWRQFANPMTHDNRKMEIVTNFAANGNEDKW